MEVFKNIQVIWIDTSIKDEKVKVYKVKLNYKGNRIGNL